MNSIIEAAQEKFLVMVILLAPILYCVWVLYSAHARMWGLVLKQIAIPAAIILCLAGTVYLIKSWRKADDLAKIFGTKVTLGAPLFDSPRVATATATDWYALTVYEMPPEVRRRFEAPDEKLLTEHPQPPYHFRWWKTVPWRETPVAERLQPQVNDMVNEYSQRRRPGLNERLAAVREALNRKGTYYGLILEQAVPPDGTEVTCAELYVVDLTGNRLHIIRATP